MFVDRAELSAHAGTGGGGAVAFRREKYVPLGGPSGGDGGRGGSVLFIADPALVTLLSLQHRRTLRAGDGQPGGSGNRHGRAGSDLVVRVPPGTLVTDLDLGDRVADVVVDGERALIARGGDGGRGNARFASSIRQAPRFAERGEPGERRRLCLELRVLADVGLLGMPNAGKSTLLAAISAARPKIAPYPFTTLEPQLGVVRRGERECVLADIPGLVAGAHSGRGLGSDFLRHLSRCRLLVHVVDAAGSEGRDPVADLQAVEEELRLHDPELAARPRILVANKCDLPTWEGNWTRLVAAAPTALAAFAVSAATGAGCDALVADLLERIARLPPRFSEPRSGGVPTITLERRRGVAVARGRDGVYRLGGEALERLVRRADLENPEALDFLVDRMARLGVPGRLRRAGARAGDRAEVSGWRFRLGDAGLPVLTVEEGVDAENAARSSEVSDHPPG